MENSKQFVDEVFGFALDFDSVCDFDNRDDQIEESSSSCSSSNVEQSSNCKFSLQLTVLLSMFNK